MARRSADDAAATRAVILDRAVAIASTDGLEGVTIGRLSREVEMSKSGVIGHFGSKERLQLEALAAARERFRREVWDPVAELPAGLTRLRALCAAWISYVRRAVFPGGCFLSAVSLEFDDRPGAVRDEVRRTGELWIAVLRQDVETAREAGDLAADVDPDELAFELNAALMGANWAYRLLEDERAFERAERSIDRLLSR